MSCQECMYISGHSDTCIVGTRYGIDCVDVRVGNAEDRIEKLEKVIQVMAAQMNQVYGLVRELCDELERVGALSQEKS